MLSQCFCWGFPTCSYSSIHHHNLNLSTNKKQQQPFLLFLRRRQPKPKSSPFKLTCLGTGAGTGTELFDQISQLAHNKVLVAAGISAAIGQLSKPFTSVLLYSKDLDFKAAFQAGGFPSTHSSAVVATATIIALERGLSDSIFGLTVVYAGLVMYDAQRVGTFRKMGPYGLPSVAFNSPKRRRVPLIECHIGREWTKAYLVLQKGVRREVGNHAKVLNKLLAKIHVNSVHTKDRENMIDSQPGKSLPVSLERIGSLVSEEASSFTSKSTNSPLLLRSDDKLRPNNQVVLSSGSAANVEEGIERTIENIISLKESIGHTEVEVIAGALLGFFVSLALFTIM
uniref:Acid phosphatase/vanadium-dependent haloperoxidase-related protein n=1 Tax=Quercus lobata TaxID=97700 RepID=A0A7N2LJM9_QUELO